jgi:hypothetical protein
VTPVNSSLTTADAVIAQINAKHAVEQLKTAHRVKKGTRLSMALV